MDRAGSGEERVTEFCEQCYEPLEAVILGNCLAGLATVRFSRRPVRHSVTQPQHKSLPT
jgi:hypothetical protein